ncbi:MAG: hypothetical protein Q8K87_11575 [Hydrogenophaga sp.]|jgi:type II secretory pathway component PulF|uniref:hypothetical protein n=1 Tax=Hydrogenophaga sp. TaxID=1904254 RepID=UPI002720B7B4|nr:hypothetical protein [Hydrogenophaga sp.]MDO9483472.1 hypothetical protein [Hydrogenophaga sp.]MDO9571840.1 hypothetical protein [Hydrogenophaga sp.]MDP1894756.1 hypothetical protein [Hydrogenophaga sp.]MDP3346070.1 hypothetical protein [Hydrogenophaga sp.]MDP3373638.1 hypothetical protein [Hydrogenophaga sp.]
MTLRQRRLIWSWIAGCTLLVLATTVHWIGWLLVPFAAWGRATASIGSEAEEAGRSRLAEILAEYPLLKAWFGVCAVTFFIGAVYVIREGINLFDTFGSIAIPFAVLLAPLVFVMERERFEEFGEN